MYPKTGRVSETWTCCDSKIQMASLSNCEAAWLDFQESKLCGAVSSTWSQGCLGFLTFHNAPTHVRRLFRRAFCATAHKAELIRDLFCPLSHGSDQFKARFVRRPRNRTRSPLVSSGVPET